MKVKLAIGVDAPWSRRLLEEVLALARADRFGLHEVVDDPGEADLVLFVDVHQYPSDWSMKVLRAHDLVRRFPEKAFVYDERDLPRDLLPGVYVGMPRRRFDSRRHRAFGYWRLITDTRTVRNEVPDLLFSFQGRRASAVRDTLLRLRHPRAVIEDSSHVDFFSETSEAAAEAAQRRYVEVVGRSKFVLCPRGAGVASIRVFEAMAAGRVPVVISDAWVPPAGIDWTACSVLLAEKDASRVAEYLAAAEPDARSMGAAAARVYDEWFSRDVWFHRVVELCGELLVEGDLGVASQWLQPDTWRAGLRHLKIRASEAVA